MATQVPYSGTPEVMPSGGSKPTPTIHVDAPLAAFGGLTAQAVSHLGQVTEHAGNELWSRAMAMQQLDQQAEAANAVADFTTQMGEKYANYRSLEGKAAVDAYKPYIEDLNKTREGVAGTLKSDYAKKLYLQESRSIQARSVFSAATHAGDQQKRYLVGTEESSIKAAVNATGLNPEDDSTFKATMSRIDQSRDMMKTLHGWSDEQAKDYITTKKSEAVFERATSLAMTKPQAAQKFLDGAMKDGTISADQAGRASRYIRNQNLNVGTRVESAKFMSGETYSLGQGKLSADQLLSAFRSVESSGNYQQIHPDVTHKVNGQKITEHGLGAYGIMQSNLQPWLKEAGMKPMTEQEFLNNPKAQDDLAKFKLNQYQEQYGSANEAARRWRGLGKYDLATGETEEKYLAKFNRALARGASGSDLRRASDQAAAKLAPDDVEFQQTFTDRNIAEHNRMRQIDREDAFNRRQVVDDAMAPASDGKLVTSIDEFNPQAKQAYMEMQPSDRARVQKLLASNARGDYSATPENQTAFKTWVGKMVDPERTRDDTELVLQQDFATMSLPWQQRQQLMNMQRQVFKGTQSNPQMTHALQVLRPMLLNAGIEPKHKEDYATFQGALHMLMSQRMEESGKRLTDEDIKNIGAGLVRQQTYSKGYLWDSKAPVYQIPVPDADREKIIAAYKADRGRDPDETEIKAVYARKMFNQFYSKPASSDRFADSKVPRSE